MSRILRHVGNKDFKRTRQRQVDEQRNIAAKKLKELQEAEEERKIIEEISRPYKSNWRGETQLQENDWTPVAGSIANSTGTTFEYPGGSRVTVSGLGGVETTPSTVTVNQSGDVFDVPGPNYSQLGLQGYAPPLGNVNRRRDYEDVNPRLDASQEFARNVNSDVFMNARVQNPKTTSVGYFSYMTPAEQLEQARDAKKRFAGGLGNQNFNDHVKGVVGYEKYQQLDDQRKANESAATKDIWDQYNEAIRSGKYELTDKLQKRAQQIQSKVYKDFVDKVEVLYFDEFKKQTGLDPFGRKKPTDTGLIPNYTPTPDAPEETPDFDSGLIPNYTSTPDAPIEDPYFQRIFPNQPVPTPDDDLLDQLAKMFGVGSAKNFLDYYADKFVKGDRKQDQNLTNLLSKNDLNYLKNALGKDSAINNPKLNRLSAPSSLLTIMQNAPRGIRNSIGNGATLDVDYFNRTGDYKIDKSYVFTEPRDFELRTGNRVTSNIGSLGTVGYARSKAGGNPFANASSFINNPMRFHVIIPGPKKKKNVDESTWSRLKKHLSEGMTSAGMGMVNYPAGGDVDIVDSDTAFATLSGQHGTVSAGTVIVTDDGDNDIAGGTHTAYRVARFTVDGTKSSHVKITISKGGGTSSWTDREESFTDRVTLNISDADDFFAPGYNNTNLSSGTHIMASPRQI